MSEGHTTEADRRAIAELLDASTRHLDWQQFDQWLEQFAPDASYIIVCNDSVTELGTVIVDTDRDGLAARIRLLDDPNRVREKIAQSHLVSWGPVRLNPPDSAQIESRFALFETRNIDGVSKLSYVGHYEDRVDKAANGQWKITNRRVVLDTFSFRSLVIPV